MFQYKIKKFFKRQPLTPPPPSFSVTLFPLQPHFHFFACSLTVLITSQLSLWSLPLTVPELQPDFHTDTVPSETITDSVTFGNWHISQHQGQWSRKPTISPSVSKKNQQHLNYTICHYEGQCLNLPVFTYHICSSCLLKTSPMTLCHPPAPPTE